MELTAVDLQRAIEFAAKAHRGQFRKGSGMPYILHPLQVMFTIMEVKPDSENVYLLAIVGLLHDVVEDCGVELKEIADQFGYQTASLVEELTVDQEKLLQMGKKEYWAHHMKAMSSYALSKKLADILNNLRDMRKMSDEFRETKTEEVIFIMDELQGRLKLTATHHKLIAMIQEELTKLKPSLDAVRN